MNQFIQYLDQFNVLSPRHSKIYDEYTNSTDKYSFSIQTKIERFLLNIFNNEPRSVIMTGNAGDGKTRICRSIYESITGQPLMKWSETGIVEIPFQHGTLVIVKDLSELTEIVIYEKLSHLQQQIEEKHEGNIYYLIAANEGKLTKFLSRNDSLKMLSESVEKRFLDHKQNDTQLHLVNLQDVTSSVYADMIINEWTRDKYWSECKSCRKASNCIIRLNYNRMSQSHVRERLVEQYRLLDCLGIHVTMREILIHISYVITGGLTCDEVLNADYKMIENQSKRAYYNNFYGIEMPSNGYEQGAVQYFRRLDPGQLSISSIDDYLLNGDISGESETMLKHAELFDEEIDLLFGYYRKLIEVYRSQGIDRDSSGIVELMPKFRRKYFFESSEQEGNIRQKLVPYMHFYTFAESLSDKKKRLQIRRELIQGFNYAFSKKLIDRSETQLFAVNENSLIHETFSASQVVLTVDEERSDIDYLPSKLYITVNRDTKLEVKLPVFEYLLRLAGGGLYITLKQEVDILLSTFRNDLISRSEQDEFILQVISLEPNKGVYTRCEINI
ncbi:hypothetical protein M5X06_18610 [Paenibacillus alvei]|uniref:Uncharacterized protein n=1 Tax=Paenibacillus alvei TaxID=44250 RepID=A0ABT4H3V8_PAEAL|nr:hypothetical protein [Paenibacillus alvei]MCY9763668.1 hypothetical protein [Paenibacillus alvei]MCY9768816.1 hypothetical protein [Paenibacillus alvei]